MNSLGIMSPLKQLSGKDGHYKDINLIGATFLEFNFKKKVDCVTSEREYGFEEENEDLEKS